MGKKNRLKRERKNKEPKPPIPYNESERNKKIVGIMFQLSGKDMTEIITPEIRQAFDKFIKTGESYYTKIYLPEYGRYLEVNLVNNKREATFVKFLFNRIRVDGEEDNPINQLNKIQEEIFQDELYNS